MAKDTSSDELYRQEMISLEEAFRKLKKQIAAEWNKESIGGLGITQARILIHLSENGPLKVSALAEILHVTSGAVTGLSDSLIEFGLIRRELGENDRRVVMLEITPAGQQHVQAIHEKRLEIMDRLVVNLDKADVKELTRILQKMVARP